MLFLLELLGFALGHLCELFLDFIDFGEIDEDDVFLPVDFLKFEAAVDGSVGEDVDFLADQGQFQGSCFFIFLVFHYKVYLY